MTVLEFPISRRPRALLRSPADSPSALYPAGLRHPQRAWRNPAGKFRSVSFFPESAAQELTLRGPGLPHHRRHPLTLDEALAGFVLALGLLGSILYLLARFL